MSTLAQASYMCALGKWFLYVTGKIIMVKDCLSSNQVMCKKAASLSDCFDDG